MKKSLNALVLAACAVAVALSGCLGPREVVGPKTFVIRPAATVQKCPAALAATLGVRDFSALQQYDRRMAVLEPDYRLGTRPNDTWAETPAAALTRCVTDALVASARFADVGNAFDMARPDTVMTGEVRAFHENRTVTPPVAELELRVELREARSPKVIWAGTLHETEPIAGESSAAFAVAMNAAVERLCAKIASTLAGLDFTVAPPDDGILNLKK